MRIFLYQGGKSETLKAGRNLSSTIETNIQNENVDSKEDVSAKKIFSYRIILGVLLKLCVNEYQHCSLKEIVSYIEAVKEGNVEVSPGLGGESVRRGNVEKEPGIRKELNSMSGIAALNFREGQMEGRKEGRIISLYYDADLSVEEIAKKSTAPYQM